MKKRLLLACALLMTVTALFAERVSEEDAALVANNFMSASVSVSGAKRSPKMVLKKSASAAESQFYVYENPGGGWVMVSASDAVQPILAYSKTGFFNVESQPDNVKNWLGKYEKQIKYAEDNGIIATNKVAEEWKALRTTPPVTAMGNVVVEPLIKTTWDQDDPYWQYTPSYNNQKTYVGCVATAMAQVMNYWQWPVKGTGSYSYSSDALGLSCSADFGNTTYDWTNMVDHYTTYYTGPNTHSVSTPTTAQKTAVATLMYHCGVAVEMDYNVASAGGSGAATIYPNASMTSLRCAAYALINNFGYKSSKLKCYYRPGGYGYSVVDSATWVNLLMTELDAARPIMYAGSDSDGGHSFVCDGYDDKGYFHFNWGWSGYCDGYYTVNNMVTSTGGAGAGNGSYNDDQDIIIGIVPNNPVTSVALDPSSVSLKVGQSQTLTPTVLPFNSDHTLNWTSNKTSVATVTKGVVTAVGTGTATITATAADGSGKKATCNVTVAEPTKYTIKWSVNGTITSSGEQAEYATLACPENPATCGDGKVFVGWTAQSSVSGTAPSDLFTSADGKTVSGDATYYAVFAKASGSGSGSVSTTVSATSFTAISGDLDSNISFEAAKGTAGTAPAVNNGQIRIYQNGGILTITANNGAKMNSITIGSDMNTSVTYAVDGGSASAAQSIAKGETLVVENLSASTVLFTCVGTDKNSRLYLNNLSVTYSTSGSITTYSDYSTVCGSAPEEVALTPTVAEVTLYPAESSTGKYKWIIKVADGPISGTHSFLMTVGFYTSVDNAIAGTFSGNSIISGQLEYNGQISSTAVTMTLAAAGAKSTARKASTVHNYNVTIEFTGNDGKIYNINKTVSLTAKTANSDEDPLDPGDPQAETCTITWMVCGMQYGDLQTVNKGSALVLPTEPEAKEGRQFYGWTTNPNYNSKTAPTKVEAGTIVNADVTYYAVFK